MSNFGKILEKWEKNEKTEFIDKDKILSKINESRTSKVYSGKHLKKMNPQDKLDLHGFTVSEAEKELGSFLENSKKRGLKKVLIVHGKGNHSPKEPVLKEMVHKYLRDCKFTGLTGTPVQSMGGSGAVWVIIK